MRAISPWRVRSLNLERSAGRMLGVEATWYRMGSRCEERGPSKRARFGICRMRIILAFSLTAIALVGGLVLFGLLHLGEFSGSKRIESCRTPLARLDRCEGEDGSFNECRWAFHAIGAPDVARCRAFLDGATRQPTTTEGTGWSSDGFKPTNCEDLGLARSLSCFIKTHHEHEATQRYLQAFDEDCTQSVILRSCNHPLRTWF